MQTNFLVIGSGISGLNFALHAAKKGAVTIITKKKLIDSSTNFAQGGIAAVLDKTDNPQKLIEDTLKAGAYHNNKKAVEFMVRNSADAIYRLVDLGVAFEKEKGKLLLTREGGHSQKRIAYVGDQTGKEIERILVKRVREHPNITILEDAFALDLITKRKNCYGCTIIHHDKIKHIFADQTILATGGIGQLFAHTTNPPIATGDGIAMAVRARCKTRDLEFIQFHPTALAKNTSPMFLLSEALRGEGAKLFNSRNKRFTKELASRDIVARDIYKELKNGPVYLDITHKSREFLKKRFPQIYGELKRHKLDLAKDHIPVTPAAHYECGGVITDLNGKTRIKNLFAFGEVACTGVHGANRLASNSLLEALVFSNRIIEHLSPQKKTDIEIHTPKLLRQNALSLKLKEEIQTLMWQYAGIVRNRKLVKKEAIPKLKNICNQLKEIPGTNHEIAETRNMAETGLLILKAIKKRRKSLGCHFVE